MSVWEWFFAAAVAVVAVLAVFLAIAAMSRRRTKRLRERFGPEYERTVDQVGDQRAAEKELVARKRERDKLDVVALSPEARERYAGTWRRVQTAFVDYPASAVRDADRLVTDVMRDRGYPIDDTERQMSDISVDHPQLVDDYRVAHGIYLAQGEGDVGTEEQREAFVHYRALFEQLLGPDEPGPETDEASDRPKEARA